MSQVSYEYVKYCVSARRHSRVWKNGVLCKRMKILEDRSESLCVCWTNVRRNTQGTHTDHGTDIATKTRNSCGRQRGVFKKKGKKGARSHCNGTTSAQRRTGGTYKRRRRWRLGLPTAQNENDPGKKARPEMKRWGQPTRGEDKKPGEKRGRRD